jgi:hypothetical protein
MKQGKQRMCIVNPALVDDISPLVGGQAEIMCRIGISWNSWVKIVSGQPVRYSLGERFKARVIAAADQATGLRRKFPSRGGGLDRAALDAAFLMPMPRTSETCGRVSRR